MCYYLKFEIKYEYNCRWIRNITFLLITHIFSFFTENGCSIQAARLIFLTFGSRITFVHKLMEDHVRLAKEFGLLR